jgi:hypothetical protein
VRQLGQASPDKSRNKLPSLFQVQGVSGASTWPMMSDLLGRKCKIVDLPTGDSKGQHGVSSTNVKSDCFKGLIKIVPIIRAIKVFKRRCQIVI